MFGPSKEARQAKRAATATAMAMLERGELPNAARALVRGSLAGDLRSIARSLEDGFPIIYDLKKVVELIEKMEEKTGD